MRRVAGAVGIALAVSAMQVWPGWAQSAPRPRLVGLPLAVALERVRAAGLNLVYSTELVSADMLVTSEPAGSSPRLVLDALLAPHGLIAKDGPNGVVLIVRAERPVPDSGVIRGTVKALDTGEPFAGVELRLVSGSAATASGHDGRFRFDHVAPGAISVVARAPGYIEAVSDPVTVVAGRDVTMEINLTPQPRFLQDVVVTPSRYGLLGEPEARQFLDRSEIQRVPHLSDDIFRVVQRLPGVAAGDISAEFGIRGGGPDETLILLDGLQIQDPYHLRAFLSLFSAIDAETVERVELLGGGFPVERGDRMSAVVDIASAVPEADRFAVGASFVTARALAQGASDDGVGGWLVSLRRGYLDYLFEWFDAVDRGVGYAADPAYGDLFASLRLPVGESNILTAHALALKDDVDVLDTEDQERAVGHTLSWYAWVDLLSTFTRGLSARTVVSVSRVENDLEGRSEPGALSTASVHDERSFHSVAFKQDWVFEPWRDQLLKWGLEVRRAEASYDYAGSFVIRDRFFNQPGVIVRETRALLSPDGWQFAAYTADRFRLTPGVTVEAGLRWDRQSWTPGNDQISPRLNVVWETRHFGTVRAAWGRFAQSQGVQELQVEDGLTEFFPAQRAEHRILTWEWAIPSRPVLRIEAYQKRTSSLLPRFENLWLRGDLLPQGEADRVRIDSDGAEARGLELVLKSPWQGRWGWWAGYALAAVEDRVDGDWQPRSWDQRHAFSFNVSWRPRRSWTLSLAGLFHSGWPTTPVRARLHQQPDGTWDTLMTVGERNSARFAPYRRIDVRAGRSFEFRTSTVRLFFEVTNLLDRENPRSVSSFYFQPMPNGAIGIDREMDTWAPIIPSMGFTWEF